MLAFVMVRDEGARPESCREGDILLIRPDSFEESLGEQDKKSYLIVKFPNPPNYPADESAADFYVTPEYGAVDEGGNVDITRARSYTVGWKDKFTEEERETIRDRTLILGTGVVSGRFTLADIVPKN